MKLLLVLVHFLGSSYSESFPVSLFHFPIRSNIWNTPNINLFRIQKSNYVTTASHHFPTSFHAFHCLPSSRQLMHSRKRVKNGLFCWNYGNIMIHSPHTDIHFSAKSRETSAQHLQTFCRSYRGVSCLFTSISFPYVLVVCSGPLHFQR
jgi:hypothetical protein